MAIFRTTLICLASLAALWSKTGLAAPAPAAAPGPAHEPIQLQGRQAVGTYPAPGNNDYSCRSAAHPNPVVFLHGLGATYYEDLNVLQTNLSGQGYCTFAITYGDYPAFPYVGGLKPIDDSANELATFIRGVQLRTGAAKIDLVAHSEGAFLSLYVPKFKGVSGIIDKIVAIAPPTHGTTFGGIYDFAYIGGNLTRELTGEILQTVGCAACNDLGPNGPAVTKLNDGAPIKQAGNSLTVIISRHDELVTPNETSEVKENGVRNIYVQDQCPNDPVGHIGLAYDTYVWGLVTNVLDPSVAPYPCTRGMPYKRSAVELP